MDAGSAVLMLEKNCRFEPLKQKLGWLKRDCNDMGQLMAALVKYANSGNTKDPVSDEEKTGKGKKNGNNKGHQHNPVNQGGNKRKADEFVDNTSTQGNNQRRKGTSPPRSGRLGPTLEQLLNEPCPRHGNREKPTTHLSKNYTIMKAFKNSNMFDGNHGPDGGSGGGGFHGPSAGSGGGSFHGQGHPGNQGGYNQQSAQSNQQQQQQQSGY